MIWTTSYSMASLLQGAVDAGWPAQMTGISSMVIAVLLLVIVVVLVVAALKLRRMSAQIALVLERISGEIGPVALRLRSAADSADQIATSLRTDVQRISRTITAANDGVQDALGRSERRLKEFDALLHVLQNEAEDAIVSAAATVRGVRAVVAAFGEDAVDALTFDDDETDDDDNDDDHDVDCDDEEIDDGDDTRNTAGGREPEPRIRSRRGRRGRAREL